MADKTVKVVVAKTWHDTDQNNREWVYVSGRNTADDSGFQNRVFAEYKGKATKHAELLDGLNSGDYIEIELTKKGNFENITGINKLSEAAPTNTNTNYSKKSSGGSGGGAAKGGNGMSKEEWAEKDAAKERSMARHKSLMCSVDLLKGGEAGVDEILDTAKVFYEYLMIDAAMPVNEGDGQDGGDNGIGDDDIPF